MNKRIISIAIVLVMLLGLSGYCPVFETVDVNAAILSETEFAQKIAELKSIFKNGEYWNNYNGYDRTGSIKCPSCTNSCSASCSDQCGKFYLNGNYYGGQCYGFANMLGYKVFGSVPTASWQKHNNKNELYAGDYIRIDNDRHSIFVTKVSGDTIEYADCNRTGSCQVRWGGVMSISGMNVTYIFHLPGNTLKGQTQFPGEIDTSISVPVTAVAKNRCSTYDGNGNPENSRWIDAGDICSILKVYKNGYVYVAYPSSAAPGGTREAYAPKSNFNIGDVSFPGAENSNYEVPLTATATIKCSTYDGNGNVESNRWIDAGDVCTILKVYKSGYVYVVYPSSAAPGGTREAYAELQYFNITPPAPKTHDPRGNVDTVKGGIGEVYIRGWAIDDDVPNEAVELHIYIDKSAYDGGKCIKTGVIANEASTDVGNHRFSTTIKLNVTGEHQFFVHAINKGGGENNPVLGCSNNKTTIQAVPKYTVSLDGNGGTSSSLNVTYGTPYGNLPKPSKTGYTFTGWFTSAIGGTEVVDGSLVTNTVAHKLYAHWTPNKYTVSLDVNGGTVSAASIQRNFNDKYGSIETPKKEGYTFTGWYKEKELKNKVLSDTVVSTANNHTLYAGWSVNAVTVKFDAKGGNCETKSTNVNFGSAIGKLPAAEWPEEGYVFDGWYKSETGNDKVSDKEVIKGETTLYAHWKKSEFKGKGTKAAPFCIETAEDLFKLSELINSPDISECYKSCYYVQTADIDLENKLFIPIGISDDRNDSGYYTFNGSYNGKYHKITGLNVRYEGKKFAGLFGKINQGGTGSVSELKNLSVTGNVYSETAEYTGGIAGEISYETVVENCDFHGKVTGSGKVGGIAGQFWQGSSISDCYVNAELVSLNKDNPYTGGLAGYITVGDNNDTRAVNFMASNFYYTGNKDKTLNGGIIGKTNIGTAKAAKIEFSSCYYNEEASSGSVNGSEITGCKSLTEKFMKNASELFGEQFVSDSSQNDEYPVFEWQAVPYQFLGEGTEESPYIIANKTDLENMRDLVNKTYFDYYKKCYRLTSDIDLENELWIPIGKETKNGVSGALSSFSGKFDGGYHTVSNLKVSEKDKFTGFFGCINNGGVLENLIITGKVQSSGASVAGVCGEVNNGRISNCGFIGDVEGNYAVGGVVGYLWNEGIVENSFQNGTVTGKDRTGGIAGAVFANAGDSIVKNSYHVGKVISEKAEVTGSALGYCSIDEKSSKKIIADNIYTVRGDCQALYNGNCTENNIIELTGAILKKAAIDISDVFMINTNESLNGGYPVFAKQPEEHFLAGDLDNDGIITLKDVVLLRKYYLDNSSVNVSFEAADVYKDGTISVKDIRVLREMYKNL